MIHVCAEIGSSHNGSLDLAVRLICEAKEARCDSIKIQFFRGWTLTSNRADQETLRPYELPTDWLPRLREAASGHGLELGCSVFDPDDAQIVAPHVDWLKVSAYDLCFDDLITACVDTGKPLVLSTAMATEAEIRHAVGLVYRVSRDALRAVLTGTACYPTQSADVQLWKVGWLRELLPGVPIGYSDHTRTLIAAPAAVALGATWIEKHFRGSGRAVTPDATVSVDGEIMDEVVERCREVAALGGRGRTEGPLACERPLYDHARRSNTKRLRD